MPTEKQKSLLITGASSGIGLAVAKHQCDQGWKVTGLAREFTKANFAHSNFIPHKIDLSETKNLTQNLKKIGLHNTHFDAVLFNAGQGLFGKIEQLSEQDIQNLLNINLHSSILLAKCVLPLFKKQGHGDLIFIGSEAALQGGQQGSIYCATKFGLRGFALSLREECANSNVRVTLIHPGMVRTAFFDELHFQPGKEADHAIEASDVAETVRLVLNARPGTVFEEISLSPQKHVIDFS